MQHRLIGAAWLAALTWAAAMLAAVAFVVPLFPRHAVLSAFSAPFPFEARPTPDQFGAVQLAGVAGGVVLGAVVAFAVPARYGRARAAARWTGLMLATGTPAIPLLLIAAPNPPGLALAVPGAVLAGWVLYRLQRHRRVPVVAALAAFGWGATFAMSAGILLQQLHTVAALTYFTELITQAYAPPPGAIFDPTPAEPLVMELAAPLWEEVAKAAGVLLILGLLRDRFPGVVQGITIGALAGAGFNFAETVRFAHTTFDIAMHHVWVRQWVGGFLFGHVLFTAVVGGAVAAGARRNPLARTGMIAGGLALAVSGHLVWNHLAMGTGLPWRTDGPLLDAFVMFPLNYITVSGPLLLVVLIALWRAGREETVMLRTVLPIEATTGHDAITVGESVTLTDPNLRLGQRLVALRSMGPIGYVLASRLQMAQLDLVAERWRLAGGRDRDVTTAEGALRARVQVLKTRIAERGVTS